MTSIIQQRQELKQQIKTVSVTEQSKIQEEIDTITTQIVTNKKEVEELVTKKEDAIVEETTARTEITYVTQEMH